MRQATWHRHLPLVYVAVVTALLLALVFEQTARGPSALPAVFVYALAAAFGLEYVCSRWAADRSTTGDERPSAN